MTKYLPELARIAREDMQQIEHDLQNASTIYSLQAATQQLFNLTWNLLNHVVQEATQQLRSGPVPQGAVVRPRATIPAPGTPTNPATAASRIPAGSPVPVLVPSVPTLRPAAPPLPEPPSLRSPTDAAASPQIPSVQGDAPVQPGVLNVTITRQGTHVVTPRGTQAVLPPGEKVTADLTRDEPELPPEPENGVNVVLPPGGGSLPPGFPGFQASAEPQENDAGEQPIDEPA